MRLGLTSLLGEARLVGEMLSFVADTLSNLSVRAERASKPILLIPGMTAGDATLIPLGARLWLEGYRVFFSGIWWNVGCPLRTVERLESRLREVNSATGRKAIVIGQSLGGIYACVLARRCPEMVDGAILLGAPLRRLGDSLNPWVRAVPAAMQVAHSCCAVAVLGEAARLPTVGIPPSPPGVRETIFYSKIDGMVNWRSCLRRGPNVEAIEVRSSHCGMAVNLEVWRAIRERLAGKERPANSKERRRGNLRTLAPARPVRP